MANPTPHPDAPRFARAMARCVALARPWSGVVFRSAGPRYANEADLLTGAGSPLRGARRTPRGGFPTVYASLDPETALAESLAHCRYFGIPLEEAMPRVFVAIRVELRRVLDLQDGRVRRVLRVSRRRIVGADWRTEQEQGREALTQALGRAAWEAGLEGLLVPAAARRRGTNLVLFPENLGQETRLEVLQADELRGRR